MGSIAENAYPPPRKLNMALSPRQPKSLEHCIRHRHSVRYFTDEDVDETLIKECVALAQLAPSNSNMQNWRLTLATGAARERIVEALKAATAEGEPNIPPMPDNFKHYRSEFGHKLYGEAGYDVKRDEPEKRRAFQLRNFEFFGAPVAGVLSMHKDLVLVDAVSVGMFAQTLVLALTERGLGCCWQVSVTGYTDVLRKEFGIAVDQTVLCGIAIGYPAKHSKVNELETDRNAIDTQLTIRKD